MKFIYRLEQGEDLTEVGQQLTVHIFKSADGFHRGQYLDNIILSVEQSATFQQWLDDVMHERAELELEDEATQNWLGFQ